MATYVQDVHLSDVSIDEAAIRALAEVFIARSTKMPTDAGIESSDEPLLYFTLRFDDRGYRFFELESLVAHFRSSTRIERLVLTLEAMVSLRSNRSVGTYAEVFLDVNDPTVCKLVVSSDSKDWCEATFAEARAVIARTHNRNWIARARPLQLAVQLLGVIAGFLISIWTAYKAAQHVSIENAFLVVFLFVFLILSNVWGFLQFSVIRSLSRLFPHVEFRRPKKEPLHWILQTFIGGAGIGLAGWLLQAVARWVLSLYGTLLTP